MSARGRWAILRDESGANVAEYALITAGIALGIVGMLPIMGVSLAELYGNITSQTSSHAGYAQAAATGDTGAAPPSPISSPESGASSGGGSQAASNGNGGGRGHGGDPGNRGQGQGRGPEKDGMGGGSGGGSGASASCPEKGVGPKDCR